MNHTSYDFDNYGNLENDHKQDQVDSIDIPPRLLWSWGFPKRNWAWIARLNLDLDLGWVEANFSFAYFLFQIF